VAGLRDHKDQDDPYLMDSWKEQLGRFIGAFEKEEMAELIDAGMRWRSGQIGLWLGSPGVDMA
jgi:hypothetical protein